MYNNYYLSKKEFNKKFNINVSHLKKGACLLPKEATCWIPQKFWSWYEFENEEKCKDYIKINKLISNIRYYILLD